MQAHEFKWTRERYERFAKATLAAKADRLIEFEFDDLWFSIDTAEYVLDELSTSLAGTEMVQ